MTLPLKTPRRLPRRWKLRPDEIPPELQENFLVRHLAALTPEEEASIERAEQLDESLGDGQTEQD